MKIESINISVFEMESNTSYFDLEEIEQGGWRRWVPSRNKRVQNSIHVLHVLTDDGLEGMCTVGDARYTTLRQADLEQLRFLTIGENVSDRERLNSKLNAATRTMFAKPGWFGAFDNCLWDITGKAAGMPVYQLLGRARKKAPAYYNIGGKTKEAAIDDAQKAAAQGFTAVKDHYNKSGKENIAWLKATREAVGPDIDLLHDAVLARYTFEEALRVGRVLDELDFGWYEEPVSDRDQISLQRLCAALDLPILSPETLMQDMELSAKWLITGATDWLRVNARHGTTSLLKLAHLAELHSARVEMNGPGGLFGLVHAHLVCAISNTSYYEFFPGGSRDVMGKEIGLLNPPLPQNGYITPPNTPGWGAEWDRAYFEKHRVAVL